MSSSWGHPVHKPPRRAPQPGSITVDREAWIVRNTGEWVDGSAHVCNRGATGTGCSRCYLHGRQLLGTTIHNPPVPTIITGILLVS